LYKRKLNAAGTKYEKPVWICPTFNSLGKELCASRQIPEDILSATAANTLGRAGIDRETLVAHVKEIRVSARDRLDFALRDGNVVSAIWQNPSRRESWTEEMKQTARERQLAINKGRNEP
jgi:hypothetical protein